MKIIFYGNFNSTSSVSYCSINNGGNAATGGFHERVNVIFIDKNTPEIDQVIPLPSHEELWTHQMFHILLII